MNTHAQDLALSREIARRVAEAGGRAMYVGGMVRDGVGQHISGNTQIKPGDIVVVFSLAGVIKEMDHYFASPTSVINRLKSALID